MTAHAPPPVRPSTISADELAHAIDNSTPYPVELDIGLCRFMAERLLEMALIHKNPSHQVWQHEEPPAPGPEPLDPSIVFPAGA